MISSYFKAIVSTLLIALALASCDRSSKNATEYQARLPDMVRSKIVAGPGEKTFEENQGIKLSLPMPEQEFIAVLKRLSLEFFDEGEEVIPTPHWKPDAIKESQIRHAYQISGKIDREHQFHEAYRAWVNKKAQVVYIENAFVYTSAP